MIGLWIKAKSWHIGKDPDAGKDWQQKEKGTPEEEMVDGITGSMSSEQTQGDSEKQGSLACCSWWGCKESDMT